MIMVVLCVVCVAGTIRTRQVLDRETSPHHWLSVIAQDDGLVPFNTRLEVLVTVTDVNDNVPQVRGPFLLFLFSLACQCGNLRVQGSSPVKEEFFSWDQLQCRLPIPERVDNRHSWLE